MLWIGATPNTITCCDDDDAARMWWSAVMDAFRTSLSRNGRRSLDEIANSPPADGQYGLHWVNQSSLFLPSCAQLSHQVYGSMDILSAAVYNLGATEGG